MVSQVHQTGLCYTGKASWQSLFVGIFLHGYDRTYVRAGRFTTAAGDAELNDLRDPRSRGFIGFTVGIFEEQERSLRIST